MSPHGETGLPCLPLFLGEQTIEAPRVMERFFRLILPTYMAAFCHMH
jgi:hypothetical protein